MSFNVPDDWGMYYSKCHQCGGTNHASGSEECRCRQCAFCEEVLPPRDMRTEEVCERCVDSYVWAWDPTDWEQQIDELYQIFEAGDCNIEDGGTIIEKISALQDTLTQISGEIKQGFKP